MPQKKIVTTSWLLYNKIFVVRISNYFLNLLVMTTTVLSSVTKPEDEELSQVYTSYFSFIHPCLNKLKYIHSTGKRKRDSISSDKQDINDNQPKRVCFF